MPGDHPVSCLERVANSALVQPTTKVFMCNFFLCRPFHAIHKRCTYTLVKGPDQQYLHKCDFFFPFLFFFLSGTVWHFLVWMSHLQLLYLSFPIYSADQEILVPLSCSFRVCKWAQFILGRRICLLRGLKIVNVKTRLGFSFFKRTRVSSKKHIRTCK